MSKPLGHPDDEQLLRYADGELAAGERERVRGHLEACWQCRAELGELQEAIRDCARYRRAVLETHLPPPPRPWKDIEALMREADQPAAPPFFTRLLDVFRVAIGGPRGWATAAAVAALVGVVAYQMMDAPSARAAELLRKAVAVETAAPAPKPVGRRIQIRTRSRNLTRVVGAAKHLASADASETAAMASLEALFREANYSWDDPLSAKSYMDWRGGLPEKRDEVSTNANGYLIRTTTGSGAVAEATLKLRSDLHAVESTLAFRNEERIEITELPAETPESRAIMAAEPKLPASPLARPEPNDSPQAAPATPGEELQVFAALRRLDADLGEPIEVTRSGRQVLVTGVGLDPERAQQIRAELASMPRVTVHFSQPETATAVPEEPHLSAPSPLEATRLQKKLQAALGGQAPFERFGEAVIEKSDAIMSRAHALRRLGRRFDRDTETHLSAQETKLLRQLRKELAQPLIEHEAGLGRLIKEVLPVRGEAGSALAVSWQETAETLFGAAQRVDRLLAVVFGGATAENLSEPLEPELTAALARLRATIETLRIRVQQDM